jgi:hypothetical protein
MTRGTIVGLVLMLLPLCQPARSEEPPAFASADAAARWLIDQGLVRHGPAWVLPVDPRLGEAMSQLTTLADRHSDLQREVEALAEAHRQAVEQYQKARQLKATLTEQLRAEGLAPRDRARIQQELQALDAALAQLVGTADDQAFRQRLLAASQPWWTARLQLQAAALLIERMTAEELKRLYHPLHDDPRVAQALELLRRRWPQARLGPVTQPRLAVQDRATSLLGSVFGGDVPIVAGEEILVPVLVGDTAGWTISYRPDRDFSIVSQAVLESAGFEEPTNAPPILLTLGNDVRRGYRQTIGPLRWGSHTIESAEVYVLPDLPASHRPELGSEVLSGLRVEIDRTGHRLRLARAAP